jgi:hypothetical protein
MNESRTHLKLKGDMDIQFHHDETSDSRGIAVTTEHRELYFMFTNYKWLTRFYERMKEWL